MTQQFTAVIQKDGDFYIAYCLEVREANGQGESEEAALENLKEAILLIKEDNEEELKNTFEAGTFKTTSLSIA